MATNSFGKATTSTAISVKPKLLRNPRISSQEDSCTVLSSGEEKHKTSCERVKDAEYCPSGASDERIFQSDMRLPVSVNGESEADLHLVKSCEQQKDFVVQVQGKEQSNHLRQNGFSSPAPVSTVQDEPKLIAEPCPVKSPAVVVVKGNPAQIIRGPQNTAVLLGQRATLKVHFIGKPHPAVKWIKGGRIVECSDRIKMETCEEMSCLTLDNVHSDDSGKYIVVVENSHGADCHFASLSVEGPPDPPASKPVISQATASSVTLCWYGSSYDGGTIVTGYIVEMARTQDSQWQTLMSNCHSTSYVARGLTPGVEYIFRIRAQNVHGVSPPSKISDPVHICDRGSSDEEESYDSCSRIVPRVSIEDGFHFNELYDIKEELGKGRFGRVHRVFEKRTGGEYAAKFIRCRKSKDKEKVKEEVDIMNGLQHPKLLQLISAFEKPKEMVIVLEYIAGGELFERVVAEDFELTEKDCILFTRQICEGVRYMHEKDIMHLDLKPENILCLHRDSHQIKLIDFGLAKRYELENPIRIMFGTAEFVAPEIINYDTVSPASDMWSVGVICYVLLSGLSPFMGENDAETFSNITRSIFDFDDESFEAVSEDAKDFISALLVKKKEKRLSAQECLKHQWLAQHERTMSSVKLSTDKLKKFIIRRKWQCKEIPLYQKQMKIPSWQTHLQNPIILTEKIRTP